MALITARVLIGFLDKLVKSQIEVVVVYETSGMTENLSFLFTFFTGTFDILICLVNSYKTLTFT